jgi:tetratricopeptide (TPR) repeat protein/TolB-like protein
VTPHVGQTISHYTTLELMGGGGMGVVYKAHDLRLDRHVALKFLPSELSRDTRAKNRMIHEARAASAISHPNICTVHDIDLTPEGQVFIVMDYYVGETIKKKLASGPFAVKEVVELGIQIGRGLACAHKHGIIHRDIKPSNIIVTDEGMAKVLDFGVAKLRDKTLLTHSGSTVGTVAYMSPEQARGEKVDQRTDIWSLGVLLYEMLTGQRPFESDFDQAVVYSIMNVDPQPPSFIRRGLPLELDRIILTALQKDPAARYQRAEDIVADLESVQERVFSPRRLLRRSLQAMPLRALVKWSPHLAQGRSSRVLRAALLLAAAGVAGFGSYLIFFKHAGVEPGGKEKLVVLPIRNMTGLPEVTVWADHLRDDLFVAEFAGSDDIEVVNPDTWSLFSAGSLDSAGLNVRGALVEKAASSGVKFALDGSIYASDSQYTVQANLFQPADGKIMFSAKSQIAGPGELAQAANKICRQLVFYLDVEVFHPLDDPDLRPWIPRQLATIEAKKAFQQAAIYMYTGEPGGGRLMKQAIALDSTFIAPRVWLLPSMVGKGDIDSARAQLRALLRLEPGATAFEKAMIEYCTVVVSGALRAQVHALERALFYAPGNRIILINIGQKKFDLEDYEGAVRAFEPVTKSGFRYPPMYPQFVRALIKMRRLDDARQILDMALREAYTDPGTHSLFAAFARSEGDTSTAAEQERLAHERTHVIGGSLDEVYDDIGTALLDLGKPGLSADYLRLALRLVPCSAAYHTHLAQSLRALDDAPGALKEATAALVCDQSYPQAHVIIGSILEEQHLPVEALEHYRLSLATDSLSVTALETDRKARAITAKLDRR